MKKKEKEDILFGMIVLLNFLLVILLTNLFLKDVRAGGIWEWMVISALFLFISPFFIVKKIFNENTDEYFLKFNPDYKEIIYSIFIASFFVAVMCLFVVKLNWLNSLRISSWVLAEDVKLMLFVDLLILPVVVFSKEFFFRGFILKRLLSLTNVFSAIVIQAILFLIFEIGTGEMISWKSMLLILFPNILLGFLAYKNKSIVVSTVFHWVYLLILDIYFYYQFAS